MPRYEGVRGPLQGARYGAARVLLGPRTRPTPSSVPGWPPRPPEANPTGSCPPSRRSEDLTGRVLSGELATGQAAVANQLINTRLRAIEAERKIKETEELATRLEALEEVLKGRRAG
jgi:hypothetical protein